MIVGRPLEFDPDVALEAAMNLFWHKGYESSSLQDLLAATGLSRSSFYQTFKSKHTLFQRCLQHYQKMLTDEMMAQFDDAATGKVFIETFFYSVAKETSGPGARRGCLIMNTASEFAQNDPNIADLIGNSIDKITDLFELAIRQAQQQGDVAIGKDARTLAFYLVSSMSGLKNMVKAGADRETIRRIADIALSTIN